MAKNTIPRGSTSVIRHIFIMDSTSTTGAGKTALAYNTAGISAYYIYPGGTANSLTLETISTLGTYSAPTSGAYMRFKEVDATNLPGFYELHFHNDWFSVANARTGGIVQIKGATGMAPVNFEFDVIGFDIQDADPSVDVTKIGGDSTSLSELKDLVDTAYDPANNKINAHLVSTGTDAIVAASIAADAASEIAAGVLTADITAAGTLHDNTVASIIIDTRDKTDNLPTDPADQSAVEAAITATVSALVIPTAAQNADAVWDELLSGHAVSGSTGEALTNASGGAIPTALQDAINNTYAIVSASGSITVVSNVWDGMTAIVKRGFDYLAADARQISITKDTWPDLTGATAIQLVKQDGLKTLVAAMTCTVDGVPGNQTVQLELTRVQTAALPAGAIKCTVAATLATSGDIVNLIDLMLVVE